MKILVFGDGWLGNRIVEEFDGVMSNANILDINAVCKSIEEVLPDYVINTAVMCPSVDWCEQPENRAITEAVNAYGPRILERFCEEAGAYLVHLSTGCLWESGEGMTEEDTPEPPSWYALTKVMGEERLNLDKTIILRLRMPVDSIPHPRNLIDKLVGYKTVLDVQNSITVVPDFLRVLRVLMTDDASGIYNVVNPGSISPHEIMEMYLELVNQDHAYQIVGKDEMTAGRSNVTLSTAKLEAEGFELADVHERVRDCMEGYLK